MLELTEALAGPYCAMMLGDFGADVIKVERPGVGDQTRTWGPPFLGTQSCYFLMTNRNKRSVTLNYDTPKGLEILGRMIASSDVLLANNPSLASLRKRGLDPDTLCARHPRLVYCNISGYGFNGPKAGLPGYDIVAQAEAGVWSFTGEEDTNPVRYPVAIADISTGIYATIGVLAALFARERTGRGQFIDMALFDTQITWLANIGSNYLNAQQLPRRLGNAHPSIVPYDVFKGGDGKLFIVAAGSEAHWSRLVPILGAEQTLGRDPRFTTNALRVQHRNELNPILQELLAQRPRAGVAREAGGGQDPGRPHSDGGRSADRSADAGAQHHRRNRASRDRAGAQHRQPLPAGGNPSAVPLPAAAARRAHRGGLAEPGIFPRRYCGRPARGRDLGRNQADHGRRHGGAHSYIRAAYIGAPSGILCGCNPRNGESHRER